MSARPIAAGYIARASLEQLETEAVSNFRAGWELVRRLGFSECQRRYGSPPLARDWPGSWFEPPIRNGAQYIATDWFPGWDLERGRSGWDMSDAD